MSLNQHSGDDGAIIGYRPDLEYKKTRNNEPEINTNLDTDQSGKFVFPDVISGFRENLPSKMLSDLKFVEDNISSIIEKLPEYFISHGYQDYDDIAMLTALIAAENDSEIDKFVDFHFNNINGSIIPELMQNEYEALKRIKRLENRLKFLYYGQEKAENPSYEAIDAAYMDKIRRYETAGLSHKVNYPVLAFDSMLNRSISSYVFDINKYAINMSNIPKNAPEYSKNGSKDLILGMFEDDIKVLISRKTAFGRNQGVEILDKTLYNYYMQRQKLYELQDLMGGTESVFIGRKIQEAQMQTEYAIKNVTRIMMGIASHLKEMTVTEQEKYYLMDIYQGLSYNLG